MIGIIFAITAAALLLPFQLQSGCESPYRARPGDSISEIAERCTVSADELVQANPHIVHPKPIPPLGQTLYLPEIGLGDELIIPVSGSAQETTPEQVYLVRPGESLGAIARRFRSTVGQLMFANPDIRNPNLIYPGQELIIPNSSESVDENAWRKQRLQQAAASASEQIYGEGGSYQPASSDEHWVLIDLASQTLHAYEGTRVVRSFLVSTGTWQYRTVTGTFKVWIKLRTDDMRGPGYDLKDVPYVMYFYLGYGLHGTYWHNNFGTPMSHGCVNLATEDAEWLFSFLDVGSVVSVR